MMIIMFARREKHIPQRRLPAGQSRMSCSSFLPILLKVPLTSTILFTLVLFSFVERTDGITEEREESATSYESAGNIREVILDRFQKRYQKWKREFLSTEVGREQWERYARNTDFTLTITISAEKGSRAEVSQYRWDENGKLIAATITLGSQIDKGYPGPFNYPVTSSLAPTESSPYISGNVLAATKIAHEFGHVNRTANTDAQLFRLQDKLIPIYNRIFFTNGKNTHDPQLIELVKQMRGTPIEIGRDRELWAETDALSYLRERYPDERTYRPIFQAIRRAIQDYAKEHIERFPLK